MKDGEYQRLLGLDAMEKAGELFSKYPSVDGAKLALARALQIRVESHVLLAVHRMQRDHLDKRIAALEAAVPAMQFSGRVFMKKKPARRGRAARSGKKR